MSPLPVTLLAAAAAAFLNGWLAGRVGKLRREYKISVGHGDNPALERRMRAQANFVENAPLFILLLVALEASGANKLVLAAMALAFLLSRVAHAIGMEGGALQSWRTAGIIGSFLTAVVLALWAIIEAVHAMFVG